MLCSTQVRDAVDPARQISGDTTAIDDRDRLVRGVDVVAGEPADLGDGWVDVGEDLERAIAEHVSAGAGAEHSLHEWPVDDAFVTARDPDRDGLGLVLDRVDGSREFVDRRTEGADEVIDQRRRGGDLARRPLVRIDRAVSGEVTEHSAQPDGGASLEMAVVVAGAESVVESRIGDLEVAAQPVERSIPRQVLSDETLDDLASVA